MSEQGTPGEGDAPKRRRRRRRRKPSGGSAQRSAAPAAGGGGGASKEKAATPPRSGAARKRSGSSGGGRRRRKKIPTTTEVSAGGVVYRRTSEGGIEVVLASRRTRRGDLAWGLAKGGIEDGESKELAAIREVREETGYTADIEADLGDTKYMYVWEDVRIRKTVHFFLMRHTGGDPGDRDDEMEDVRWFPLERAMKRAAYRGERDVLTRAAEILG